MRRETCSYIYIHTNAVTSTVFKPKGKVHSRTGNEGPEREYIYRSTLSLTSALDGMIGQHHTHGALLRE
jgi:hypothetical protein